MIDVCIKCLCQFRICLLLSVVLDAVMLLMIPRQYVLAQSCRKVCPSATVGAHDIEIAPTNAQRRKKCNSGKPETLASFSGAHHTISKWCWCNFFCQNCIPCGTCNQDLVGFATLDEVDYTNDTEDVRTSTNTYLRSN